MFAAALRVMFYFHGRAFATSASYVDRRAEAMRGCRQRGVTLLRRAFSAAHAQMCAQASAQGAQQAARRRAEKRTGATAKSAAKSGARMRARAAFARGICGALP